MTATYWIARHGAPEMVHRIPVYSAPPQWVPGEQRWISGDGRAVCIIDGEENAKALLGIDAVPSPGRCVSVQLVELERAWDVPLPLKRRHRTRREFPGYFDLDEVHYVHVTRLPWVQDVTDELRGAQKETS